jgi:hypothetical protein
MKSTSVHLQVALPYMREMVKNTFGRPITIELLEKISVPVNSSTAKPVNSSPSCVVVNPSLISQTTPNSGQQTQLLYTTVQPQQKINLMQQSSTTPTVIGSTTSLLGQQQQQQLQARASIVRR